MQPRTSTHSSIYKASAPRAAKPSIPATAVTRGAPLPDWVAAAAEPDAEEDGELEPLAEAVWLAEPDAAEPVDEEPLDSLEAPLVVPEAAALLEPETVVVTEVTLPEDELPVALPVALEAEAVREPVAEETLGVAMTLLSRTNWGV
jgi:hypothetical protein